MPEALVAAVIVVVALLNVPLAPEPGAVKVTLTPGTGLLPASFTVTATAFVKTVLTEVLCGVVPALAVIVIGVLVIEKFTVTKPAAAAETV